MNDVKKIIYNCRKATLLIEKKELTSLTLGEKMELKLHLAGCSVCRTFQRQSIFINKQLKELFKSRAEITLDDKYKQEIQKKVEEQLGNE